MSFLTRLLFVFLHWIRGLSCCEFFWKSKINNSAIVVLSAAKLQHHTLNETVVFVFIHEVCGDRRLPLIWNCKGTGGRRWFDTTCAPSARANQTAEFACTRILNWTNGQDWEQRGRRRSACLSDKFWLFLKLFTDDRNVIWNLTMRKR